MTKEQLASDILYLFLHGKELTEYPNWEKKGRTWILQDVDLLEESSED